MNLKCDIPRFTVSHIYVTQKKKTLFDFFDKIYFIQRNKSKKNDIYAVQKKSIYTYSMQDMISMLEVS